MMLAPGDGLDVAEGIGTLDGDGNTVDVEDGTGVAQAAINAHSRTAATGFIDP
jgi:hypothetical protein